jgi:nicotinamide-nucleotide amidase
MNATIITIGDELLIGQIIDTNSAWLGQQFNAIGIRVYQRIAVGDQADQIIEALKTAERQSELIILTGGLGPTKDDITKKTLCEYFDSRLIIHEPTLNRVKSYFEKRGKELMAINKGQAMVPDNCEVLENERGTAPGMWFDVRNKIFISLPGVPHEMKYLMSEKALEKIKARFQVAEIYHRNLMIVGLGESKIAMMIAEVENSLPEYIKLAYLPELGVVKLRLSGYGVSQKQKSEIDAKFEELKIILQKNVFATKDISLQEAVGEMYQSKKTTFAIAESCTGGYVGHLITSIPGSSGYFKGSLVTYSYDMKENILGVKRKTLETEGAVSEKCVKEMVEGLLEKTDADVGVAISGIAGPDGGLPNKPVGTVCFAVGKKGNIKTYTFNFFNSRMENIRASATMALNLLRKEV